MLRQLIGEPKRMDQGELLHALRALEEYREKLARLGPSGRPSKAQGSWAIPKLEVWTQGFAGALDELEESKHCAEVYGKRVRSAYVEEMHEEERLDYRRYVYFYKNAFIRVFSVLDKLGYFLDELYALGTGRVKARFSYFTALRQMHERRLETELDNRLFELKQQYQDPLQRLRSQRNMEIHLLNAEMVDDMLLARKASRSDGRQRVENVLRNLSDLAQSFEMVCRTVTAIFEHAKHSARS